MCKMFILEKQIGLENGSQLVLVSSVDTKVTVPTGGEINLFRGPSNTLLITSSR